METAKITVIILIIFFISCRQASIPEEAMENMYSLDLSQLPTEKRPLVKTRDFQAEDAGIYRGSRKNSFSLYTGKSYVHFDKKKKGYLEWHVESEKDEICLLSFRYINCHKTTYAELSVNGQNKMVMSFAQTAPRERWVHRCDWQVSSVLLPLKAGRNLVLFALTNKHAGFYIDKLDISGTGIRVSDDKKFSADNAASLKGKNLSFIERIRNRTRPPLYKDWRNYSDQNGGSHSEKVAKFAVSWDIILPKGESAKYGLWGTILGLEWDRTTTEYPLFSTKLINLAHARKVYDEIHSINPTTMLGVELRWDVLEEYEMPVDHEFWKLDRNGNKVMGRWKSPPVRYEVDCLNPDFIDLIAERCKVLLNSGVVDFILLDHMLTSTADPTPFMRAIRERIGPDKILIGNTHRMLYPELVPYIDGWGEEHGENATVVIPWWENHGERTARFNCWEFLGEKDDLASMRYYTTLVMTLSDATLRYVNKLGRTEPKPWYDFHDVEIGRALGRGYRLNNCFAREYENGTTVCNNTGDKAVIGFTENRTRASDGKNGKEFTLNDRDGDMFLYTR